MSEPVNPTLAAEKKKKKKKKAAANSEENKTENVEQQPQVNENASDATGKESTTDASKKKKKKAGEKKDDKTKGKGPNKKILAAMQEALAKVKEEEAARLREEEERVKKELELERIREEQEKKKLELKNKKKLKEKARKEKLKKEGKYLTAKQKADKQRAQASLEILKQQGLIRIGNETDDSVQDNNELKSKSKEKHKKIETINEAESKEPEEEEDLEEEEDEEVEEEEEEVVVDNWEDILDETKKPKADNLENKENKTKNLIKEQSKEIKKTVASEVSQPTQSKSKHNIKSNKIFVQDEDCLLRSPIVCVLGHVDTGKTKLLDYIRKTHVQDNEAGGITQQIGATFVPPNAIKDQCKISKKPTNLEIPGFLIIDTPGHESFTNLRSRGSSLCDIAILVIDIMHGLEPQTIESINLLKSRKTPFIVALNKIDRLYDWQSSVKRDVEDLIKTQQQNTKSEFEKRTKDIILQLNEQSLNAALYYENQDVRYYVSLVPTSAVMGDGMGNLINLMTDYCQTMLHKKLVFLPDKLEATVLEVKALPGLGTTIDVVLVNGKLKEGDKIVLAGHDGPVVTQIRSLLVPQPLRELRVKSPYQELKTVKGSIGVKICGHDLEKAVAGLELYVAKNEVEVERLKSECWEKFGKAMKAIKTSEKGVSVEDGIIVPGTPICVPSKG
ncbi:hypothetical protein RND71_043862 [Anisodus tanguticus]|uniref:Tr-type G domain-containing protein n=1 Tax=Anisodus tanguticus TaxID=243964 RepID=A0AAE1UTF3_9SOLA|nr:hypothetical protein RND71_043862 [Anisodus tanguticus]